ncbi:DUF4245 domain-containing protein [Pseudonocardia xinjiangensis]|uniref:DUF4245 domain-containing protein n=1 Tax=Pseudonocardia xinjiangensis TaxID=75289 RepID=UPI003D92DA06
MTSEPNPPPRPTGRPDPGPPSKPPRSAMTMRDMLVALGVLIAVVIAIGGLQGSWSFAPAGPSVDPAAVPVVDAPAELRELAPLVPFAVRIPAVPPDWRSNSVDQDPVDGGGRAVRTGYITPDGRYVSLLQSDASEQALLAGETGKEAVPGRGPVDVDGQQWVAYGGQGTSGGRDEPIWITEIPTPNGAPVRMLITGSGSDESFRTLAEAAQTSTPIPPR